MPRYWICAICKKWDLKLNEPSIQCSKKSCMKWPHKLCANVILTDYENCDFTCCKCLSEAKVRANNNATNISTGTPCHTRASLSLTPEQSRCLNSQSQAPQTVYTWSYLPLAGLGMGRCPLLYYLLLKFHC